jgi:ribosomal protein S9
MHVPFSLVGFRHCDVVVVVVGGGGVAGVPGAERRCGIARAERLREF